MEILFYHSKVLREAVEAFAKKHDCLILLTNEILRRFNCDEDRVELYRRSSGTTKSIFVVSCEKAIANVNKYYLISDRWESLRNVKLTHMNDRNFGFAFAENN